ncbi:MAG: hypothetical protein KF773_31210 [Deltaproteobacteria bacterium]|nr:hypothetical protein [Deltaproteobacteria bacterium]
MSRSILILCFLSIPHAAVAESQDPPPPAEEPPPEAAPAGEAPADPEARTAELTDKLQQLETKLAMAEDGRRPKFPIRLSGYGDIGAFATQGDGSGLRRDYGHMMFPQHNDIGWVFYGDLLATAVNSRGDVADLGEVPGVDRFDAINSGGHPTFLVNELNLTVNAGVGSRALFTSSVNFTPRNGTDFRLGDSFDVDLVQLEYVLDDSGKHSIFVGKFDSVIGHEYKTRKAPDRFGITPTLLARYTTGTAIGIKARSKLANDHIILAAAVTNGSFGTEQFHFHTELDTNAAKTLSGRAALRLTAGALELELGPSGQWGVQDGAPDGAGTMLVYGVDAELRHTRFAVKAQWLRGQAPGDDLSMAYSLDLKQGGYLETDVILTPTIGLLGRAEFRDAEVQQGFERLYITKNWRATAGLRLLLSPRAVIKAEYSHNGEYGATPAIPNDVVTTSAVMAF